MGVFSVVILLSFICMVLHGFAFIDRLRSVGFDFFCKRNDFTIV